MPMQDIIMSSPLPEELNHRTTVSVFIAQNTARLSLDLLHWQRHAKLPANALYHQLAEMCKPLTSTDDEYQIAERYLIKHVLEQAAKGK